MRLIIETQYMENYGAHDWSGEGVCPQYWKCKGGSEYELTVQTSDIDNLDNIIELHRDQIEHNNDYSYATIAGWHVIGDSELTRDEYSEMEFEGEIKLHKPLMLKDKRGSLYDLI